MKGSLFEATGVARNGCSRAVLLDLPVGILLCLEAGVVLATSLFAYHQFHSSWIAFALLFLLPDLSMLGYLLNPRAGAWSYNLIHTYLTPVVLSVAGWLLSGATPSPLWLIWFAHIGFDRLLGYGLKNRAGFGFTHLGTIGSGAMEAK